MTYEGCRVDVAGLKQKAEPRVNDERERHGEPRNVSIKSQHQLLLAVSIYRAFIVPIAERCRVKSRQLGRLSSTGTRAGVHDAGALIVFRFFIVYFFQGIAWPKRRNSARRQQLSIYIKRNRGKGKCALHSAPVAPFVFLLFVLFSQAARHHQRPEPQ